MHDGFCANHQWVNPPEPPRSPLRPCQWGRDGTVWKETGCQHCGEVIQTMSARWYIPSLQWAYLYFVLDDQILIFGKLKISGHLGVGCSKYTTIYKKGWGHVTSQITWIKVCHVDHTTPRRHSQDFTNTFLSLLLMRYSSTKSCVRMKWPNLNLYVPIPPKWTLQLSIFLPTYPSIYSSIHPCSWPGPSVLAPPWKGHGIHKLGPIFCQVSLELKIFVYYMILIELNHVIIQSLQLEGFKKYKSLEICLGLCFPRDTWGQICNPASCCHLTSHWNVGLAQTLPVSSWTMPCTSFNQNK